MAQDLREADRAYLRGLLYTLGDGTPPAKETKVKTDAPKKIGFVELTVYVLVLALIVASLLVLAADKVYGVNLLHWLEWQGQQTIEQSTGAGIGDAATDAVTSLQAQLNAALAALRAAGGSSAPPAEADAPALRGPKPGVTWDGKSIKAGKVVEESKAAPVDEPKYGKAIPTAEPLVAQPAKPSKAQPTTEKVERQGKETRP